MSRASFDSSDRALHVPVRTCIGCRRQDTRRSLIRLVASAHAVVVDESGDMPGRGAYVHPATECLERLLHRRQVGRAFRRADVSNLTELEGLLLRYRNDPSSGAKR